MQIYQWSSEVVEEICSLQQLGVKQTTCPDHRGRLPLCAVQSATHHQHKMQPSAAQNASLYWGQLQSSTSHGALHHQQRNQDAITRRWTSEGV